MITTPRLLKLIEACRDAVVSGSMSAVPANLVQAVEFYRQSFELFEFRAASLPLSGPAKQPLAEARELFARQKEALDDIERAVQSNSTSLMSEAVARLEESVNALRDVLARLSEVERSLPRQSAIPVVDQFVKSAANVDQGLLPYAHLQQRLPLVGGLLQSWRICAHRFFALYEAPPGMADEFERSSARIETALRTLAESAEPAPTQVAAILESTTSLVKIMEQMDAIARDSCKYSRIVAVEDLHRALQGLLAGKATTDIVNNAAANLYALGHYYISQTVMVASHPLCFTIHPQWMDLDKQIRTLLEHANPWFERLQSDPQAAAKEGLEGLRPRYESVADALQKLQEDLQQHSRALEGLPLVQELVNLLGLLAVRGVSPAYVKERVEHYLKLNRDLAAEAERIPPDPVSQQMRVLLAAQLDGLSQMARYLDDADEEHLRRGFQILRDIHPQMMEMHRHMRTAVETQQRANNSVLCFKCGASNDSGRRFCASCNASLPMLPSQETVYTDVTAASDGQMPRNLSRLQNLFTQARQGSDLHPVSVELADLRRQLSEVSAEFERTMQPRIAAGDDPLLAQCATAFRSHLTRFIEGVEAMQRGAESHDMYLMESGLETAMQAGEHMQIAQREMHAGLGTT